MKKKLRMITEMLIAGILVFIMTMFNVFSPLDYQARDALYQRPRGIDSRIKIIGIDEKTLGEIGPVQTWSRSVYADLLDKLYADPDSKPMLTGFDIILAGNVDEGDDRLAEAAARARNIVTVNHLLYGSRPVYDETGVKTYGVEAVEEPYDSLKENCVTGFSNVSQDSDGIVRRIRPVETYEGRQYKMFSYAMYDVYCSAKGITPESVPVDKSGRALINYSGRPKDYECISMTDVLNGRIDTRTFKDSIVLVGAYASGTQDIFSVPTGKSQQMFGVEIHANILQSYIDGSFSVSGNVYILGLVSAVLVMLIHLLFRKLKPWQSLIILVAVVSGQLFVLDMINNKGYSFSIIYFPLMLIISYVYSLAVGYLAEWSKRKKVLDAFRKYVAPEVVEEISKKGDFQIKLGGENRDIAVLFVDIRGFTTMSENLEPEQVVAILNEYLSLTTKAIFDNSGTLDKFVGDATMAVFNSPFDLPDYEMKAVCAAMDIVNGGKALEKTLMEKYGRTIGFGVGVNVGPAVVGNIGCEFRMDFTAIGDTVNTAARLEANAKKGQVLISDALYERLKDRIEVKEIGEIPLKGKSKGVFVYEVTEVHNA